MVKVKCADLVSFALIVNFVSHDCIKVRVVCRVCVATTRFLSAAKTAASSANVGI